MRPRRDRDLLTDVVRPALSGPVAVERLRSAWAALKVICMPGYIDDAITQHGVLQQRGTLRQKSFTPAEVTRLIGDVLDGW